MSAFKASRQIWRKELAVQNLRFHILYRLPNGLGLPTFLRDFQAEEIEHSDMLRYIAEPIRNPVGFLESLDSYLEYLEPSERNGIERLIRNRIKALASGRKPTSTLTQRLESLSETNLHTLANIQPSTGKAKGSIAALIDLLELEPDEAYDAMCLLSEEVSEADVALVVSRWKVELRNTLARQTQPIPKYDLDAQNSKAPEYLPNSFPVSHIFWTSRDFQDTKDAVARYRFIEAFRIGEFPETATEIENMFAGELVAHWDMFGQVDWMPLAFNLWLASRSAKLCARIRPFLEIALAIVANQQTTEGWWYVPDNYRALPSKSVRPEPDNYPTALACTVLLRLSRSEQQVERAREGAQWLARQQGYSGGWTERASPQREGTNQEADLFTTLLAAEAIRTSGLEGYATTLSLSDSWILLQQKPDGTWRDNRFSWPFTTILVVEHLENRRPSRRDLEGYLSVARDFIMRSQEFALEDNENARRLAIVTAFQGVEAFLYACLSEPSVNIPIFREQRPRESIGMRLALDKLEEYLKRSGALKEDEFILLRNSLSTLAYQRGEIVHKAQSVNEYVARQLTKDAAYFAQSLSQQIFGFPLL